MSQTAGRGVSLVVMAAGMGSRYGGLKQIEPVGPAGETLLEFAVFDALRAGFTKLVFVVREEFEDAFEERMEGILAGRVETAYVCQRTTDVPPGYEVLAKREKPWGTAHAVWSCRDAISEPFAVINADDFYGASAFRSIGSFLFSSDPEHAEEHALIGYQPGNTLTPHGAVTRGICEVQDGYLVDIRERRNVELREGCVGYREEDGQWCRVAEDAVASMNLWGFRPSLFEDLDWLFRAFLDELPPGDLTSEFLLPTAVGNLIAAKRARVRVLPTDESWLGMTYREDLEHVVRSLSERIRQGQYPSSLWQWA